MSTEPTQKEARKWQIPQALLDKCVAEMEKALDEGSIRDKQTAATIIKGMVESNLKQDEFDDKRERLDSNRPTEISDLGTIGTAVADLTNRLGNIVGDGAGTGQRTVQVVDPSKTPVRVIEGGAEPSDADDETTRGT